MIEFHERIYHEDGKHEDHLKQFSSKHTLLKVLKKSPMPNEALYDLKKRDEAITLFQGKKRRFQIVEIAE